MRGGNVDGGYSAWREGDAVQVAPSLFSFDLSPSSSEAHKTSETPKQQRARPLSRDHAPESAGVDGDVFTAMGAKSIALAATRRATKLSAQGQRAAVARNVAGRIKQGKIDHRAYRRKRAGAARAALGAAKRCAAAAQRSASDAEAASEEATARAQRGDVDAVAALAVAAAAEEAAALEAAATLAAAAALAAASAHIVVAAGSALVAAAAAAAADLAAASAVRAIEYTHYAAHERGKEERRRLLVTDGERLTLEKRRREQAAAVETSPTLPSTVAVNASGARVRGADARPRGDAWVSEESTTALRFAELDVTTAILKRERDVQMLGSLIKHVAKCMDGLRERDYDNKRECARLRRWYYFRLSEGLEGLEKYGIDAGMASALNRATGGGSTRRSLTHSEVLLHMEEEEDPSLGEPILGRPEPEGALPPGMSGAQAEAKLKPLLPLLRGCGGDAGIALVTNIQTSMQRLEDALERTEPQWRTHWLKLYNARARAVSLTRAITVSSVDVLEAIGAWRDLLAADALATGQTKPRTRAFAWRNDASYVERMQRQLPGVLESARAYGGRAVSPGGRSSPTQYRRYDPQPLLRQWFEVRGDDWSEWGTLLIPPAHLVAAAASAAAAVGPSAQAAAAEPTPAAAAVQQQRSGGGRRTRQKMKKKRASTFRPTPRQRQKKRIIVPPDVGSNGEPLSKELLIAKLRLPIVELFAPLSSALATRAEVARRYVDVDALLVEQSLIERRADKVHRSQTSTPISPREVLPAFLAKQPLLPSATLRQRLIGQQQRKMLSAVGSAAQTRRRGRASDGGGPGAASPPPLLAVRRSPSVRRERQTGPRILTQDTLLVRTEEEEVARRHDACVRIQSVRRTSQARKHYKQMVMEIVIEKRLAHHKRCDLAGTKIQHAARGSMARMVLRHKRKIQAVATLNKRRRVARALQSLYRRRKLRRMAKRKGRQKDRARRQSVTMLAARWRGKKQRRSIALHKSMRHTLIVEVDGGAEAASAVRARARARTRLPQCVCVVFTADSDLFPLLSPFLPHTHSLSPTTRQRKLWPWAAARRACVR